MAVAALRQDEVLSMHRSHVNFFNERSNTDCSHVVLCEGHWPGPHVAVFGGIHGNERGPVQAEIEVIRAIEEERLKISTGSVSFVLGNPAAYLHAQRFLTENLNRLFISGPQNDTPEGHRANEIILYASSTRHELSGVLDLHSVSVGDMQAIIYCDEGAFHRSPPPIYDFYMKYERGHIRGMLPDLTEMYGIDGLLVETGNHESEDSIYRSIFHIRELLQKFGILTSGEMPHSPELAKVTSRAVTPVHYKTIAQIDPSNGFRFIRDVATHTRLQAGEVYAENNNGRIAAPQDCYIVMPDLYPHENDSDAGFLCVPIAA